MAKQYSADELAWRTFAISMVGVGAFIAVVLMWML